MAKYRHLGNAPITEALTDFRVTLPSGFNAEVFSDLKTLSADYPKVRPIHFHSVTGKLGLGAEKPVNMTEEHGVLGYSYLSQDGRSIAQFRANGFTHNRLKPYGTWDDLISESKRLWELYLTTAHPEGITRLAVRYINHLNVPANFTDYIRNPVNIPEGIPQTVSTFLSRVVIEDMERGLSANITQTLEKSKEPNCVTVILDIDVYKQHDYGPNDDSVWKVFERMRELKNLVFFSIIKEKAVEKYL